MARIDHTQLHGHGDYSKHPDWGWQIRLGEDMHDLSGFTVTENDDGSITVDEHLNLYGPKGTNGPSFHGRIVNGTLHQTAPG